MQEQLWRLPKGVPNMTFNKKKVILNEVRF